MRKWSDLMFQHQEDLARLMTLEQGKILTESRGEVAYAAGFLEWFHIPLRAPLPIEALFRSDVDVNEPYDRTSLRKAAG